MIPIRVLIADDHQLFRAGVRAVLQGMAGVDVVAEAGDGREAVALAERHRPDVALLDIGMPGVNGLEAAARLAEECPGVRVVILSMHATEQYVSQALRVGAAGYLLKESSPAELEAAVRAVAGGESYLTPAVSRHLVAAYRQSPTGAAGAGDQLTPRQSEVLQLIGEGKTTKEIARALGIGVRTVETHRAQLMKRLDVYTVAGLVRCAARAGLVTLA
jgi:DNA-binding NarL/FixJ family response regulator